MTAKSDRITRLVNDEDLKQGFQDVRDSLHQKFASTKLDDSQGMTDIRRMLHLIDSVEANLHRAIEDGKLEDFRAAEGPAPLGDIRKWMRNR